MAMSDRIIVMRAGQIEQEGSPSDIYRRPRSRFVANFIGASNIAEGMLASIDGATAFVSVNGAELRCRIADTDCAPRIGEPCEVAIRRIFPQLYAQERAGLENQWPGTVISKTFLGDIVEYIVEYPGGELHIQSTSINDLSKGDRVFVHVPQENAVLIGARPAAGATQQGEAHG